MNSNSPGGGGGVAFRGATKIYPVGCEHNLRSGATTETFVVVVYYHAFFL